MTVEQLIEILKTMPKDMLVISGVSPIEEVMIYHDYPLGDAANPNCEYADVVLVN